MNHHEPTSPDIDPVEEELVAYLDEELEPEHRAQVEHRLAEDARYRDKLRHMQKSWDMLDLLARSEPDEGFTRTTVAMVALKAKEATDVQKETTQRFSLLFKLGSGDRHARLPADRVQRRQLVVFRLGSATCA
jgi:anti-sigma factor RsiW